MFLMSLPIFGRLCVKHLYVLRCAIRTLMTHHHRLPTSNILSYSQQPSPVSKSGSSLTYGPYQDIEGYKYNDEGNSNIRIHYEDPKPVLVDKTLLRDVWVSHWGGRMSVEEHYELVNEGAK